jgi:hypothetical protein
MRLSCAVVAELHEADLGDLIAALDPDGRVSLVRFGLKQTDPPAGAHR